MAFFQLILEARRAEKVRQNYEDEKFRSIEISRGAKPHYTLRQRLRMKRLRCKRRMRNCWKKMTSCPEDSWFHRKAVALRTDGTFENYIAKSILGFFAGVFLTYIFFVFFVLQLHFTLSSATVICTVIGAILTVGLAFSLRVRCVVFLLLPQFFSKRGRHALMAYVLILALTGPVKNILHNVGVLSESLTCGQEQLKEAVKMIVDLIKQPFYALREAISKVIKGVKLVVKNIKRTLLAIKRLVLSILRVIKSVFQWLGSIVNMCNKKLGTPFDRCQRVFEGAVADCKAKLGPVLGGVCNLTYIVGALCYIVKPLDFICMLVSYVADTVVDAVKRKIKRFTAHMKAMFYVKIKFSHSFHFETNQSKSLGAVSKGIVGEIHARTDRFLGVFDFMSFLATFFIFFMLLRVIHYRYKWLTSERFDNRYITEDLRKIDLRRARQDKETVLPLNHREKTRYTTLTSIGLIKSEKLKLARSAVFLGITTFKIIVFICIDYSLYWILSTIQYHGQFETKIQEPNVVTLHVSGNGYLAQLYRSIVKAFTPESKEMEINSVSCLPDPNQPNYDRYAQIIFLIILCWIIVVFEPYGLRIRQVVMCRYYPNRAKQRAAWLYNHIIRSRGSFLKFARRQLRRKFGLTDPGTVETVTFTERLVARCPILNLCFSTRQKMCLLCGAVERSEENPHIKCSTPGCVGLYCIACYTDLHNLCTICRQPVEYGDLSDISEEIDSSDDGLESLKWRTKVLPGQVLLKDRQSFKPGISWAKGTNDFEGEILENGPIAGERIINTIKPLDIMNEKHKQIDDDTRETESSYSYSYQDLSSPERELDEERIHFRDVEAQIPRDDVTIQIFNEPSEDERDTSSLQGEHDLLEKDPRTNEDARLKRGLCPSCQCRVDSDSSTESYSSEEKDDPVDSSEELLLKNRSDKKKPARIRNIVSRLPCFAGNEDTGDDSGEEEIRGRHSFVERIVGIFQGRHKETPYKTLQRTQDETLSSSSESCNCDNHRNNVNLDEFQKRFSPKQFPRYSGTSSEVASYETNEKCGCGEDINALSNTMTCYDRQELTSWNIVSDDGAGSWTPASGSGVMHGQKDKACLQGTLVSVSGNESDFRNTSSSQFAIGCMHQYKAPFSRQETSPIRENDFQEFSGTSERSLVAHQNSELIEELKDHNMIREIREREARGVEPIVLQLRETSTVRDGTEEIKLSDSSEASSKIVVGESLLAYQQTEAYKNVVSELSRRAILRGNGGPRESSPTISFPGRIDKPGDITSMHQLFGPQTSDVTSESDLLTENCDNFRHALFKTTCDVCKNCEETSSDDL